MFTIKVEAEEAIADKLISIFIELCEERVYVIGCETSYDQFTHKLDDSSAHSVADHYKKEFTMKIKAHKDILISMRVAFMQVLQDKHFKVGTIIVEKTFSVRLQSAIKLSELPGKDSPPSSSEELGVEGIMNSSQLSIFERQILSAASPSIIILLLRKERIKAICIAPDLFIIQDFPLSEDFRSCDEYRYIHLQIGYTGQFVHLGTSSNLVFLSGKLCNKVVPVPPCQPPFHGTKIVFVHLCNAMVASSGRYKGKRRRNLQFYGSGTVGAIAAVKEGVLGVVAFLSQGVQAGRIEGISIPNLIQIARWLSLDRKLTLGLDFRVEIHSQQPYEFSVQKILEPNEITRNLEIGDIVSKVNGDRIYRVDDIIRSAADREGMIELEVIRHGRSFEINANVNMILQ